MNVFSNLYFKMSFTYFSKIFGYLKYKNIFTSCDIFSDKFSRNFFSLKRPSSKFNKKDNFFQSDVKLEF